MENIAGAVIGVVEIGAGVALTTVTGGAAYPLVGDALIGAGVASISYSISTEKFSFGEFAAENIIGASVGASTGFIALKGAAMESGRATWSLKDAAIRTGTSMASDTFGNVIERVGRNIYSGRNPLEGAGLAFVYGLGSGGGGGLFLNYVWNPVLRPKVNRLFNRYHY